MNFYEHCIQNGLQSYLQWHSIKNNGISSRDVSAYSNKKAWWVCSRGHEWRAAISNRAKGVGCPVCAGKSVLQGYNDLVTSNPELTKEWHTVKNKELQPYQVTAGSGKMIWWICKNNHEWVAAINSRSKGHGCPYCSGNKAISGRTDLATINPALALEWHPTYNQPLTPDAVTTRSSKKVWWRCGKGHEWPATIGSRFNGNGCPYCSGKKAIKGKTDLATLYPAIAKEWHISRNDGLYPNMVTAGSGKRVWWQCKKGHEWQAVIASRTSGNGCPYCSNQKVKRGQNDLATLNPLLAKQWHPVKNDELSASDVVSGSRKKVWWQCKKGHEWQATIDSRNNGTGCPYCTKQKVIKGENDLATLNPLLAKQWHPVKNLPLTPENVSAGSGRKMWWQCEKGHEWQTTVASRTNGQGCPYCSGRKAIKGFTDLATVNQTLSGQWHPIKNLPLTPENVSAGSGRKVWWLCDKEHEWQAAISSRSSGRGCPYCSGKAVLKGYNDLNTINPQLAKQWHPDKNGNLTPYEISISSGKAIWWQCPKGHEWQASPNARNNRLSCPICNMESHTSFPEQAIFFYIKKFFKAHNRYIISNKEIDIYIPLHSIGIEHDGPFHDSKEMIAKDRIKEQMLSSLGIQLIRIKIANCFYVNNKKCTIRYKYCQTDHRSLEKAIQQIFTFLTEKTNQNYYPDININRDENEIYEQYMEQERANGLFSRVHDAKTYWSKRNTINPTYVSPGSHRKVWWECPKGHEWQAQVKSFSMGTRCPFCAHGKQRVLKGYNDLGTKNPNLSGQWHPTRNEYLTPQDVTAHSGQKVWWKCEKGHEWKARVADRSGGARCPYCSGRKPIQGINDLATLNKELAAQWHPVKNGNLKASDITTGSHKKIWWQCPKGHEWQAVVYNRTKGHGCPYCVGQKSIQGANDLATLNKELAAQWHSVKNGELAASDVIPSSGKRVGWQCLKGHEWQATVANRTNGQGCPYCSGHRNINKV